MHPCVDMGLPVHCLYVTMNERKMFFVRVRVRVRVCVTRFFCLSHVFYLSLDETIDGRVNLAVTFSKVNVYIVMQRDSICLKVF